MNQLVKTKNAVTKLANRHRMRMELVELADGHCTSSRKSHASYRVSVDGPMVPALLVADIRKVVGELSKNPCIEMLRGTEFLHTIRFADIQSSGGERIPL